MTRRNKIMFWLSIFLFIFFMVSMLYQAARGDTAQTVADGFMMLLSLYNMRGIGDAD